MRPDAVAEAFFNWDVRGRGWETYPHPVSLSPEATLLSVPRDVRHHDDTRHETALSRVLSGSTHERRSNESTDKKTDRDDTPVEEPLRRYERVSIFLPDRYGVSAAHSAAFLSVLDVLEEPLSFELDSVAGAVSVGIAAPAERLSIVSSALRARFPEVRLVGEQPSGLRRRFAECELPIYAVEFGLGQSFFHSLLRLSDFRTDPLAPIVQALQDAPGPSVFQILATTASLKWRSAIGHAGQLIDGIESASKEKLASPLCAVALRVAVASRTREGATTTLGTIATALGQLEGANDLVPVSIDDPERVVLNILNRSTHRHGMLLSRDELVGLFHLPSEAVKAPGFLRLGKASKAAPDHTARSGVTLGENPHAGETQTVHLTDADRLKHVHVIGASGTGKSTLLQRMILDDIDRGHGVGVLDPHGDLVDELLARIPRERQEQVVLLDPGDPEYVVGLNILDARTALEKELLASDLAASFKRLSTSWGDQMTTVLSNAVLALLESTHQGTLLDLRRFLVEESFRKTVLGTVGDSFIQAYWTKEYPLIAGKRPQAPILTRLNAFLRNRLVRDTVTMTDRALDVRRVIDDGRILLARLSQGAIGQENASLLGSLLLSKLQQVTMSRQELARGTRAPFFLYLDEFHELATPSLAELFSGARKYGLGLTVAHQNLYQLRGSFPAVESAVLSNAHTRICFRLGERDATRLAEGMSFFDASSLVDLGVGEAIVRVGKATDDFNVKTRDLPAVDPKDGDVLRRRALEHFGVSRSTLDQPSPLEDGPSPPITEPPETKQDKTPEAAKATDAAPPSLSKEALDFLEHVARVPFATVRDRNADLGHSAWAGQRLKTTLLEEELVREVSVNPGGRGTHFKLLELTSIGRRELSRLGVAPAIGLGRGGVAHQWWVQAIASWLTDHGLTPIVEDDSQGVRVDLTYTLRQKRIAVEVEMGLGHIKENVTKDREAGFDQVVTLLHEARSLSDAQAAIPKEHRDAVTIGFLQEHEALLPVGTSSLAPPNQNQERSGTRRRRQPAKRTAPSVVVSLDGGALTTPLAAEYLGLSPATLETMRTRGGGPVFAKLGRRVVYERKDLDAWVSERKKRSTSDS